MVVSPSDCLLPTHPHGKICSFYCARGYQVSGPSSARCGIGGSWSEDANTIICDGLYLDRLSFTPPSIVALKISHCLKFFGFLSIQPESYWLVNQDVLPTSKSDALYQVCAAFFLIVIII